MKRLLFVLVGLAVVASTVTPVFAMRLGAGYFRPEAPVGVRLYFTDEIAGDLGIGLQSHKFYVPSEKSKIEFRFDLGVPIVIMGEEDATKWFFRPGFAYVSTPAQDADNKFITEKTMLVSASLGVEHYVSKNFSVQVAHGIVYQSFDSGLPNSKKVNTFETEAFGISSIGFHYYFWESK